MTAAFAATSADEEPVAVLRRAGVPDARAEARRLKRWADATGGGAAAFAAAVAMRARRVPFSRIVGRRAFWKSGVRGLRRGSRPAAGIRDPHRDGAGGVRRGGFRADPSPRPRHRVGLPAALASPRIPERHGRRRGYLPIGAPNRAPQRPEARVRGALRSSHRGLVVGHAGKTSTSCSPNPPYIPTGEIGRLEPEVAEQEPGLALDGGADGLDAYRRIAPAIGSALAPGGFACFEIGRGMQPAVAAMFRSQGLAVRPSGSGSRRAAALSGRRRIGRLKLLGECAYMAALGPDDEGCGRAQQEHAASTFARSANS